MVNTVKFSQLFTGISVDEKSSQETMGKILFLSGSGFAATNAPPSLSSVLVSSPADKTTSCTAHPALLPDAGVFLLKVV
ncbi:MAG: hypothetical protein HY980_01145 [Candidatus Magasanikbacteria bacterium]|nr:hypothetical protein [Candidatus Magasanikbacteria bacterium]